MDEDHLLKLSCQGDLEAFNCLVLAYQDPLVSQAYHLLGDDQLVVDIVQETFLAAFRKVHQFRGGSFRAWLFKIATNLCLDEIRRWKKHPVQPLEPIGADEEVSDSPAWPTGLAHSPEQETERNELIVVLESCLHRLPLEFRTPVILVDIQGFSYAEAAAVMGTSLGTLKGRLARGRLKMHQSLIVKSGRTSVFPNPNSRPTKVERS